MRQFVLKTFIIFVTVYILFQITLGNKINEFSSKIKSIANQQQRIEIKKKILNEMKKGTEKEYIFSDEERVILSNFINKILNELKEAPTK